MISKLSIDQDDEDEDLCPVCDGDCTCGSESPLPLPPPPPPPTPTQAPKIGKSIHYASIDLLIKHSLSCDKKGSAR